jgi:hypothetical protein
MTIGSGTFSPAGRFTFPRSYVYDLVIYRQGTTVTRALGAFTIHAVPPDPTFAYVQVRNNFYFWNSNRLQLPYIVSESWYKIGGVGAEIPLPFELDYAIDPITLRPTIYYTFFGGKTDPQTFTLPEQPSSYWLPPILP